MKVKIEFTVNIDEEAWMEIYDVERSEIRTDVKAHIEGDVKEGLADDGLLVRPRLDVLDKEE